VDIHYLGKISATSRGNAVRQTACRKGDERSHFISSNTREVTCKDCRKHGIFRHGEARQNGFEPQTGKQYFDEYDRIVAPSQEETERLEYYRQWQRTKLLSMVDLYLDGINSYWVERNPVIWKEVAALYLAGEYKQAEKKVRDLNRRSPQPPWDNDEASTTTSIDAVNEYRRNGYRIPEFGTGSLMPSLSELSRLQQKYSEISDLDDAIAFTGAPKTNGSEIQVPVLPSDMAFELAAITAEGFQNRGNREDWFIKAVNGSGLPIPRDLIYAMARRVEELAPPFNNTITITLGSGNPKRHDADFGAKTVNSFFEIYRWMDTTVIPKSCEAAEISRIMAKKVMDLANSVEPEEAQTLRRLASAYKLPRGILLPSGGTYELTSYRDIFRMQSGSEARRLRLLLT
jgi:hypothetical protein